MADKQQISDRVSIRRIAEQIAEDIWDKHPEILLALIETHKHDTLQSLLAKIIDNLIERANTVNNI